MVNNRTSLDPRWTRHHTPVAVGFMLATIRIYRRDTEGYEPVYDFETGKWSNTGASTLWTGKARVQPYGIIGDQIVAQDPTGRRLMRVQVEAMDTTASLDDQIEITACPDNPELTNYRLEVRGSISSSNAWLTDLVCEADLKWHRPA